MLALKIIIIVLASFMFLAAVLVIFFKKDFLIWDYEEHVKEDILKIEILPKVME